MKMPEVIPEEMFAPCGINCGVCYRHLRAKKPCLGCLRGDENKPAHCLECAMKRCAAEKGISRCFACASIPCQHVKRLDKTYRTKYGVSMVEQGKMAHSIGIAAFLSDDRQRWLCPNCGGAVSQHDGVCSECGEAQ